MANMATIKTMPAPYDIHTLHPSKELPSSPASELKNAFKGVFKQALEVGPVSITRSRKREAVLLSTELYDQIIKELASRDPLEILRKDYDERFAGMQSAKASAAYEDAFNSSPEDLGKAAAELAVEE